MLQRLPSIHPGRTTRFEPGFTLVEMLAAMTVLSLLVVMMSALVNSASLTMASSNKRLNADDQARLVFDRMQMDFGRMLNRSDVYFQFSKQTDNDQFTFYSETPGAFSGSPLPASQSNLSLINYNINSSYQLERLAQGCQWGDIAFSPTGSPVVSGTPHVLSSSVFRMEIAFLQRAGNTSVLITGTPPSPGSQGLQSCYAVMVALGVLDADSQKLMSATSYPSLIHALPDFTGSQTIDLSSTSSPAPSTIDPILAGWHAAVNASNFAQTAGVPQAVAQRVHIYQRVIYLQ